jgi:thiol-disulfide isomerase/thioredoxin
MESGRIFGKELIIIVILIMLLIVPAIFLLFTTPGSVPITDNKIHIVYFYRPSCESCTEANKEIERVNQSYPGRLEIRKIDISTPMNAETHQIYMYYAEKFDLSPGMVPLVIVNETIYLVGADSVPHFEGIVNGSIVVVQ